VPRPACRSSDLAPNAPDSTPCKRGDTLWDISKLFLKSPGAGPSCGA
jgi:nucleoid-associated protein YgaU